MLKYSPRALPAIVKILQGSNDINLFVEDTTSQNIYKTLFYRLLPEIRIAKIFQCEGRKGVIAAANDVRYNRLRRKFFLIDGDLYLLCGEKYPIPSNVFKLKMYCVENGIVCLSGLEKIAFECEPNLNVDKIQSNLSLKKWFGETIKRLAKLYTWYAAAMFFGSQSKTTSVSGLSFLVPQTSEVDPSKVSCRIKDLKTELENKHGKRSVANAVRKIKLGFKSCHDLSVFISAKSYLIPLIARHVKMKTSFTDEKGLTMRLCHCCELSRLSELRAALVECISNG